jgi:DinB superfamily
MGARSDTLARQFEAKAQEAAAEIEKISESDWKKVTEAEKWSVGVTAHHLAGAFEAVAGIATTLAAGGSMGNFNRAMLDELNARHAKDHAGATKAETLTLYRKGVASAAATVRGLTDEQLDRRGTVFADAPAMTVEQFLTGALIKHIDDHAGSIRKTVAR